MICGCSQSGNDTSTLQQNNAKAPELKIDTTTPDKTIKSYWAVMDAMRAWNAEFGKKHTKDVSEASGKLPDVMTASLAKPYRSQPEEPETFDRDIIKVEMETESRATVIAKIKNTSPIPEGAKPSSADDVSRRMEGEPAKYILEKTDKGWRVAEVWEWDTYPSPGWRKERPFEDKPKYPTYTFYGR